MGLIYDLTARTAAPTKSQPVVCCSACGGPMSVIAFVSRGAMLLAALQVAGPPAPIDTS